MTDVFISYARAERTRVEPLGRDLGKLLPVLLEDVSPKIGFRQFQTIDFRHWSGAAPLLREAIDRYQEWGMPKHEALAQRTLAELS